jgi:hypothetical protein
MKRIPHTLVMVVVIRPRTEAVGRVGDSFFAALLKGKASASETVQTPSMNTQFHLANVIAK